MSAIDTEEQSKYPPERLRGLVPYKRGQSGNPGGIRKGTVLISEAYKRLLLLPVAEVECYEPKNAAEQIAKQRVLNAIADGSESLPATKEITDRTEGKAVQQRVVIDVSQEATIRREARTRLEMMRELNAVVEQASYCEHCERIVNLSPERIQEIIIEQFPPQLHRIVIAELRAIEEGG